MHLDPGRPVSSPARLRAVGEGRAEPDLFLSQAHVWRVYERVRHTRRGSIVTVPGVQRAADKRLNGEGNRAFDLRSSSRTFGFQTFDRLY